MKLTMLGTGNAMVTKCFNTCFTLTDGSDTLLVDGGGGNVLLSQLEKAGIDWRSIHEIIVTHNHIDHILGIIWMLRMILQHMAQGQYEGEAVLYAHDEVIELLKTMVPALMPKKHTKHLGERMHLVTVHDGEIKTILGRETTFFDIGSTKAKQYGFTMRLKDGAALTCCGDEPYNEREHEYAVNSRYLLHEAFCLYGQADIFKPYEKHHSTAKDAAELAQKLQVENLLLYHTEDKNIAQRKALYTAEAKTYFQGNVLVPDDLESIEIAE